MIRYFIAFAIITVYNWNSSAAVLTVDINAAAGLTHIQDGIGSAGNGDTVLVMPGRYYETLNFTGKDIVVASMFLLGGDTSYISRTIIDGSHANSRLVKFTSGETRAARLVGFTLTHAYHDQFSYANIRLGLGIYVAGSSPSIENNRILDNEFGNWYLDGGGICLIRSAALLQNNLVQNNQGAYQGAGIYMDSCSGLVVRNNIINANSSTSGYGCSEGTGVCIMRSDHIELTHNIISNNLNDQAGWGGGFYAGNCTGLLIVSNQVFSNNAEGCGGGFYLSQSQAIFCNNLVYGNHAVQGAGIYFAYSGFNVVNSTFSLNATDNSLSYGHGGGIYLENSSPHFYNTILFGDQSTAAGPEVAIMDSTSAPVFENCDIQGGKAAFYLANAVEFKGTYSSTIEEDPFFRGYGEYPFSLEFGSPCMDAGKCDTTGLFLPPDDLAGFPRISLGIDIGAYEYQHCIGISKTVKDPEVSVFPNPAGKTVHIRFQHPQNASVIIYDCSGKLVYADSSQETDKPIEVGSFKAGLYLVSIRVGNNKILRKFSIL